MEECVFLWRFPGPSHLNQLFCDLHDLWIDFSTCLVGLATSWRWIPKNLLIKVSKSCQKVAISFKKLPKSCWISKKLPKYFCFSHLFWVLKITNSHIASYQNFLAFSGVRRLAPSLLASAIGLLGPSSTDLSDLGGCIGIAIIVRKSVQRDTADFLIRHQKNQSMGGGGA